ncbi:MAG TPA: hypothetical protein VIO81_08620 [Methyloversatilis sp.]
MNLQPHDCRSVSPMLSGAIGLSALLHLVLLWPSPPVLSGHPSPAVRAHLTLREAATAPVPPVADVVASKARRTLAGHGLPVIPGQAVPLVGSSVEPGAVAESQPALPEPALRALRFALARGLAASAAELPAVGATLTLELHFLNRHVIGLAIVRSSGSAEFDAQVLAAFKAAAGNAVIPESLPVEGFVVELELEGGEREQIDNDRPHASG